jgi:hypothetical protein
MFELGNTTKTDRRKFLALLALTGAIIMAYNAGNYLSRAGIFYYAVTAIALLVNYRRSYLLLWAAVGMHAVLVGYALWQWQAAHAVSCIYCFGAAGFALLAASVYTRPAAAIVPALLAASVWMAWPYVFADITNGGAEQPGIESQYQIPDQQPENQEPEVKPEAAIVNGTTAPTAQSGLDSVQSKTQQEQTPAVTAPDSRQGNTPDTNISGAVTPEVEPDSGPAEKPAEPAGTGSS